MSIEKLDDYIPELTEENTREYWKNRAGLLGITYPNNIKLEDLKSLVQAKLAEQVPLPVDANATYKGKLHPAIVKMQDEATKLVRFKITVLDPNRASWTGMLATVGNANLVIKRAIYFIDEPWHAEKIVVDYLKGMKYVHRPVAKDRMGKGVLNSHDNPKMLPVFHIEELPPLTQEELNELAKYQAANNTGQSED